MKIPCDVISRLSHVLPSPNAEIDPIFRTFRLDNGMVMVSDRNFMAIEEVGGWDGVFYIAANEAMIEQCHTEAQYSALIDFNPVPAIQYTTAITSNGWRMSDNLGVWPTDRTAWDSWRDVILTPCLEPLIETKGPISFGVEPLQRLAQSSPSGMVVLEEHADPMNRPMVVRDVDSSHWVGFFRPRLYDGRHHNSASVPGWCK